MYTTDITSFYSHGIGGVMVSVLTSSVVDRGSEPCFGHLYFINIYIDEVCFYYTISLWPVDI
jgi:hypothetical protein